MAEYKSTLNLPDTRFPMKANLVQKEPETLKFWEEADAYRLMQEASGERGRYVLHDGPPYANGHIHLGTALNKILKDIVVKSRNLLGWTTPYVPGWDCHGRPSNIMWKWNWVTGKRICPLMRSANAAASTRRNFSTSSAGNSSAWAFWATGPIRICP